MMKIHKILSIAIFILLLNPIILECFNIKDTLFITTINSSELSAKTANYNGPPTIPNIIWGNVYINGIKITAENECTLILKICNKTYATFKMGEEKKLGDLYRFVIPAYSESIGIFVLYNETLTKAYSLSNIKTAEIIRYDISIFMNRKPERPLLLSQLTPGNFGIPIGGTIYERTVFFKGCITDPDNDKVKLQIELNKIRDFNTSIKETILYESELYESGQEACLSVDGLVFASYKWQARTIDENGNSSDWVCFGDNENTDADFIIEPYLRVSENRHDFGNIEIGTYKDWEFSIFNLSSKSVILNQISSSNSVFIVISPNFPYELSGKSTLNVKLRFVPDESKAYLGVISIITDDFSPADFNLEDIGLNIILTGTGKDGKPDLKPICITFPEKPIVMEKTNIILTIKNDGTKRSTNGHLKIKLFVYDENENPLQGSILDIGNIESIKPGKSIDVSFQYIFISSKLSNHLDLEIQVKNSMDSNLTNNIIRYEDFRPEPNPTPFLNFVGDLLVIAGSGLLDGTETKELIESIISYAYEKLINNYDFLIEKPDIDKIMTFYYRTIINTYRNVLNLKDKALILRVISCAKNIANKISEQKYPLAYRLILRDIFDAFWRMVMQKNDQWSAWELYLLLLYPKQAIIKSEDDNGNNVLMEELQAGLIVENSNGKVTSIIEGKITEDIKDSFAFYFEGQIAIAIIGDDTYKIKVKGISDGEYGLFIYKPDIDGENLIAIKYENIPISYNSEATLLLDKEINNDSLLLDSNGDGITDNAFIPDSIENIALEDVQITIPLSAGWNLISIPVQLLESDINNVLQSIVGKYQSVWTYENKWRRHFANAVGQVNDLNRFETGKGYWLNMIEDSILVIKGKQIIDTTLQLNSGWNLVGYTSLMPRTIERAIASISNRYLSVWSYNGSWKRNIAGAPSLANTLLGMEAGKGYWINVTTPCQWNIRSNVKPAPGENLYCQTPQTNMPQIPCVIFGRLFINGLPVSIEKDSSISVILKVNGNVHSLYKLGSIEKYNDCYLLEFPPINDNSANLELYVQKDNTMVKASSINNIIPGELSVIDLSVNIPLRMNALYQNFPNPFNPETWIPYSLKSNSKVKIIIHNISGQLIRTLDLGYKSSGSYNNKERAAYWDGTNEAGEKVSSGVYFYTIKTDEYISTRKMILLR